MRILLSALSLAFLLACGSPTGPGDELPTGPLQMAIVSGDGQEVAVTDTLPSDIVAQITKGGQPLTNQLVDWVVLTDNCGAPFVTTTRTDSAGVTGNRIVAGTRAWTRPEGPDVCEMEVRYALTDGDSVIARVDTTVGFFVEPGRYDGGFETGTEITGDSPLTLDFLNNQLTDQYGNPALWRAEADSIVHPQDSAYGDRSGYTLVADSAGRAAVCLTTPDTLIGPALVEVDSTGFMQFSTQGHSDPTNAHGEIQRSDCR